MKTTAQIRALSRHARRLPWLVLGLTLAILGGTILLAREQLRSRIREQLTGRDGAVLHVVALRQLQDEIEALEQPELARDPATQVIAILKTSRLKGVLAQRLYDSEGGFVFAFPPQVASAPLEIGDLDTLRTLNPVSRFRRAVPLDDLFPGETSHRSFPVSVLEVNVPLHGSGQTNLAGIAQFILEGASLAAEFDRLDQNLTRQAGAAFVVGGGVVVLAIGWAFGRLRRTQELLEARTNDLLRVNEELVLAAKTSALGAVSAYLIHGLKNPLSGLQSYVSKLSPGGESFEEAITATRRMQRMINEVITVLREENGTRHYEVTTRELAELVRVRTEPAARETAVTLRCFSEGDAVLQNRVANLVLLILVNLVENALQASSPGDVVCLRTIVQGPDIRFEVTDQGDGLSDSVRAGIFAPCHSSKESGSGLGLAISKQLANHLGAELDLTESSIAGTTFVLRLPTSRCQPKLPMEVLVIG